MNISEILSRLTFVASVAASTTAHYSNQNLWASVWLAIATTALIDFIMERLNGVQILKTSLNIHEITQEKSEKKS